MRIDPHTHSNASDGTDSPSALMRKAASIGLDVLGLTDHDTTAGWEEASQMVAETGVSLLRGIEISAAFERRSVHVLGFLFDPNSAELTAMFDQLHEARLARLKEMVVRLKADYPKLTWQLVREQAASESVPVGRPHLADAFISLGYYPNREAAFDDVLSSRSPYYVHYRAPDCVSVTRAISAAGGVVVLAHPYSSRRSRPLTEEVLAQLVEAGLWGLEQRHREHTPADREYVAAVAARFGLQLTGGSDYHGLGKPNQLGENGISGEQLEALVARGKLPLVTPVDIGR